MRSRIPQQNKVFYQPITEVDLHGLRTDEAIAKLERIVKDAPNSVYRIRVIHGFHRGTNIRTAIRYELDDGRNPKIIKIENGSNEGITELVLKEYF